MSDTPQSRSDDEALSYARNLAVALHRKHFSHVTNWKPLDDMLGLLTQIGNMIAGLVAVSEQQLLAENATLRQQLAEAREESMSATSSSRSERYRKKPVEVVARQWLGGDYAWLDYFCGRNWTRADVVDMSYDDPEQVVVWNTAEKQYLHVPVGHWLIRGVQGELYPCKPDIFAATYEPASAPVSEQQHPIYLIDIPPHLAYYTQSAP